MDILKSATDWAKAELFSTPFFVLFGFSFTFAKYQILARLHNFKILK